MAQDSFDIIFVGSGIGAMIAAAIQVRRGKHVLVLEKQKLCGGYATIFAREGATFDVSLHQIGGVHRGGMKRTLQDAGIYDSVEFLKHKYLTEIAIPEQGKVIRIPNGDFDGYMAYLEQEFPEEKAAIRRWFRIMRSYGRQIAVADWAQAQPTWLRGIVLFFFPLLSLRLFLSRFFVPKLGRALRTQNPVLRKILLHFDAYYGLPANQMNALFPMTANYGYYRGGGYYVRGGGFGLVRALSKVIQKNGGVIKRGASVNRIITDDESHIQGVMVEGSETPFNAPEVVCSANTIAVLRDMLADNPHAQRALRKLQRFDISMTASVLYIKLDVPIGELNPELADSYEYVVAPKLADVDYFQRTRERRHFNDTYEDEGLVLSLHSNIDPECKNKDKDCSVLDVFFTDNYERWGSLSREGYDKQKQIEQDKMLDCLETLLPGVRSHIASIELGTPLTMERYTSNEKGAIYGFAQQPQQSLHLRPEGVRGIRGLHFVSAWGNPGGGYEGSIRAARNYTNPLFTRGTKLIFVLMLALSILLPNVLLH